MASTKLVRRRDLLTAAAVVCGAAAAHTNAQWAQWGGPNRNFAVETSGLADKWPDEGPKRLWHRTLGSGFSSIVADDGMLFTMYRKRKTDSYEYTVSLDAATGKTLWQKRHLAAVPAATADYGKEFTGPNATPLIAGDRLFTLGRNAALHCYQKTDGTILWKHELRKDFGAQLETCGYSCSPVAYGNTILVPLGRTEDDKREGNSLIAFDQETGDVVWRNQAFRICHSSPILINVQGEDQYVLCTTAGVIGVNPRDGELLWEHSIPEEQFAGVFATPIWNGQNTLYVASREWGYGIGLTGSEGKTTAEQVWASRKVPLGMGTPVLIGEMVVGSKRGPGIETPLMAVDMLTGKRLWLKRSFPMAVSVGGAEKLIILDHTGRLGLATATRDGLTIHTQSQITEKWSFTVPTLVGKTLYVRDEKQIMALDLG